MRCLSCPYAFFIHSLIWQSPKDISVWAFPLLKSSRSGSCPFLDCIDELTAKLQGSYSTCSAQVTCGSEPSNPQSLEALWECIKSLQDPVSQGSSSCEITGCFWVRETCLVVRMNILISLAQITISKGILNLLYIPTWSNECSPHRRNGKQGWWESKIKSSAQQFTGKGSSFYSGLTYVVTARGATCRIGDNKLQNLTSPALL